MASSRAIFLYPIELKADMQADLELADRTRGLITLSVNSEGIRRIIRAVMHHDTVLMPSRIEHHTEVVERIKKVALLAGLHVRPIGNRTQQPTAAPAARQTQPGAAVGN